jgi:hypothetical protein
LCVFVCVFTPAVDTVARSVEPGRDMTKHKGPHDNLHIVCLLSTDNRIFK